MFHICLLFGHNRNGRIHHSMPKKENDMKQDNKDKQIPFDNHHAAKTLKPGVFAPPYQKDLQAKNQKSRDTK